MMMPQNTRLKRTIVPYLTPSHIGPLRFYHLEESCMLYSILGKLGCLACPLETHAKELCSSVFMAILKVCRLTVSTTVLIFVYALSFLPTHSDHTR